jgi:hypothetical protein
MVATFAGMFSLSLLKSRILKNLLLPPPRCRQVILPWLFRPPLFFKGARSDFSGVVRVISSKVETVLNLEDGVTGLNDFMGISFYL